LIFVESPALPMSECRLDGDGVGRTSC